MPGPRRASHRNSPVQHRRSGSMRNPKAGATPEPIATAVAAATSKQPPPRVEQLPDEKDEKVPPGGAAWPGGAHRAGPESPGIPGLDPAWWWPTELQHRESAPDRLLVWEMRLSKEHGGRPYCTLRTLTLTAANCRAAKHECHVQGSTEPHVRRHGRIRTQRQPQSHPAQGWVPSPERPQQQEVQDHHRQQQRSG